jgi:hypothetical protein
MDSMLPGKWTACCEEYYQTVEQVAKKNNYDSAEQLNTKKQFS